MRSKQLVKALKTAITHINEEPDEASHSDTLVDLVDSAVQRLPNREENGLPRESVRHIVTAVVHALAPLILTPRKPESEQIRRNIQKNTYDHDALEQYSRKENVRIHGAPENNNEDKL